MPDFIKPVRLPVEPFERLVDQEPVAARFADADKPEPGKIFPHHQRFFGEFMIAFTGQNKRFIHQRSKLYIGMCDVYHIYAEICVAIKHGFEAVAGTMLKNADANIRVMFIVITNNGGQKIERSGR